MLLKYFCCANLCLYVRSLKIPRRWCDQSVNNVPLKLTCASVCLQPVFDVLWAGWKIFVSFLRCSFCHNLDRELNKDPVPKDQTRGAICSIPCQGCDKSYIGETKRKFSTRLKEPHKSALAEHCLHSSHTVSRESSKILRTNTNWRNRSILEAWEINTCGNPLNRYDGIFICRTNF